MSGKIFSIYLILLFLIFIPILGSCSSDPPPSRPGGELNPTDTVTALTESTATTQATPEGDDKPQTSATSSPTLIPYSTPSWFQEAVIYEIFVRSYFDSDKDGIGDIQGIISQLEYLQSVGVNTLWLMPVHPSPSVPGYDVSNYFDVNTDYGTIEDLQQLVEEAHNRDIKIIMDFVPSHLSDENPIFQDAYGNPESSYSDWFVWNNDAQTLYAGFANSEDMPRFNHYNPEVVDYLTEAALFWLDLDGDGDYTDGVDGFRVDNATFPPQEFLTQLRQAVKSVNPDAVLLGETWVNSVSDMNRYFEDQFDALFDFSLYQVMQGNKNFNGDGVLAGNGYPILISNTLNEQGELFHGEGFPVRFLSNHDTNRIASEVSSDPDRLRLAASFLAALPDPVLIYYGEEIGMLGQKGGPPYWDNYRREPMDWYRSERGTGQTDWFKPEDRWNKPEDGISVEEQDDDPNSLLNMYRLVFGLRKETPALLRGDYEVLNLDVSGPGPWGITRMIDDEYVVALFNFSDEDRAVTINDFPFKAASLIDILNNVDYPGIDKNEPYSINIPAMNAIWLVRK